MTDHSLCDIAPEPSCQGSDDQGDGMTLPNLVEIGDSYLSKSAQDELASTDLVLSPCPSFSEFDMDSYLTPPLTSLETCVDTTASERATPRPDSSVSMFPCVQGDPKRELGHGSNTLPPSSDSLTRCQCLRLIEVLLQDLERKKDLEDPAALDLILAWQKSALAQCSTVLRCSACGSRPEYILLLGLITERLATLCESMVSLYLKELRCRSSLRKFSNGRHHSRTLSEESITVFFGRYEIESKEEWSSLIRVLMIFQLRSLRSLLGNLKIAATAGTNTTQLPMMQATERRVGNLTQKLRHLEP